MVTDSPYTTNSYSLTPAVGMVAGVIGSGLMLLPPMLAGAASVAVLNDVLALAAGYSNGVLRLSALGAPPLVGGTALHAVLGALLGLLYAVCQSRRPVSGLVAVGFSYGFTIWIFSGLVAAALGHDAWAAVRSWPWLLACLTYGTCLAVASIWSQRRSGSQITPAVPLD